MGAARFRVVRASGAAHPREAGGCPLTLRPDHALDTAPPAVRALAAKHRMGFTFRTYEAAARRRREPVWIPVGVGVYVAGFTTAMAFLLIAGGSPGLVVLIFLFVLILLVAAIRMVVKAAKAVASAGDIMPAGSRVYLFDSGLVHSGITRGGSHKARAFLWDEVSVFRHFNDSGNTDPISGARVPYTYTVERPDRRAVVLRPSHWPIADIEELGGAITARVGAVQVPRALAAVRRGQTVRFGSFAVNDRGFRYYSGRGTPRVTPWDRIERIYLVGDEITVWKTRRFLNEDKYSVGLRDPNDWVLVAVAETLIRDADNHG
jgi:hypothetical protein